MINFAEIDGKKFGRLAPICFARSKTGRTAVLCRCDCGEMANPALYDLRAGKSTSCGCARREAAAKYQKERPTHRLSKTGSAVSWRAMIRRCYCEKDTKYKNYGGSGVIVCNGLRASPVALISSIGERPDGMSIDRIDGDESYTCGECSHCVSEGHSKNIRWSTRKEQAINRSTTIWITFKGERRCMSDWAALTGIRDTAIRYRFYRGDTPAEILSPWSH